METTDPYAELLDLCAQGDQGAFQELYRLAAPRLFGICIRMLHHQETAEDVLQEGFVKIWQNAGVFDPLKGSAMTWMVTVMRNRALDRLRTTRARPEEIEPDGAGVELISARPGPAEEAVWRSTETTLAECLSRMSEQQQRCIRMAYYEGHTHTEIARQLDRPLGTVKAWVRRGLRRLEECLGERVRGASSTTGGQAPSALDE